VRDVEWQPSAPGGGRSGATKRRWRRTAPSSPRWCSAGLSPVT